MYLVLINYFAHSRYPDCHEMPIITQLIEQNQGNRIEDKMLIVINGVFGQLICTFMLFIDLFSDHCSNRCYRPEL